LIANNKFVINGRIGSPDKAEPEVVLTAIPHHPPLRFAARDVTAAIDRPRMREHVTHAIHSRHANSH